MGRGDLTHAEWVRLRPHLPKSGQRGGRWIRHRKIINGISYPLRTGVPWRDLPARFGSWKTAYERHRRWSADGTWDRIFAAVLADADAEGRIDWSMVNVDSTSCRAHQHVAGARRRMPRVPGKRRTPRQHRPDEGLGRSRGGPTCKIHIAGEGGRRPLALLITPGQWGDAPQLIPVMERIRVGRQGGGHPRTRPGPATSAAIKRTLPATTVAVCDNARSSTPSPNRRTSGQIGKPAAARVAAPSASTNDLQTQKRS